MSGSAPEDRTEAATPKRLQTAREEGRIPVSRELVGFAGLAGVTLALLYQAPAMLRDLQPRLSLFLARMDAPALVGPDGFLLAGSAVLRGIAPFVLASMLAGAVGVLAQTFDHRALDGAYSAAFLREVKMILESRDWVQALNA